MTETNIYTLLSKIYRGDDAARIHPRLLRLMQTYRETIQPPRVTGLSPRDAILITYPDQVQRADELPLHTLTGFCARHLQGLVSALHILPFYPSSSDGGFSVMDYRAVSPNFGDWTDIQNLGDNFRLMFDAVVNHASAQGTWFKKYLGDDPQFMDFFISVEGNPDLSSVVRPRALPLLTTFRTKSGPRQIWTTFSADQVDLNYANPEVLLAVVEVLLFYVSRGAQIIRLDAIAYLWKEIGTNCIHRPQTHAIVQLLRAILNEVAPYVMLITETNVPHAENISYFGDGFDEAQMVYNFSLPPLVLHTFQTGNAQALSCWAGSLELPSNQVTFFNFLASHDGIGLNPLRGILSEAEIEAVVERVESYGGLVSYKSESNGEKQPYELNVNYFDALNDPRAEEPLSLQIDRFIAAHAILLSVIGVPGIYFHSLFGSRGWPEGVAQTGQNRTINRQKLQMEQLERELADGESLRAQIFHRMARLLRVRAGRAAFDPFGRQRVVSVSSGIFALLRASADESDRVLCLQNVTAQIQIVEGLSDLIPEKSKDLIAERSVSLDAPLALQPYQTMWLVEG